MAVSISLVRTLVRELERRGISTETFLQRAGLSPRELNDPSTWIDLKRYDELQLLALDLTGDPAFGLAMGEHASLASFSVVGHLVMACNTGREGLEMFFRFYRIVSDIPPPRLEEEGAYTRLVYTYPHTHPRCNRLRAEFGLTLLLSLGRQFAPDRKVPEETWFDYPAPPHAAAYERIFGDTVRFGKPHAGFVFASDVLDQRQLHADPALYDTLRQHAEELLRRRDRGLTVHEQVRERIAQRLHRGRPTLPDIAADLGISERTLRRKLEAEGATYQAVADEALGSHARALLRDPRVTIQQAADRMGFSEASSFNRAFKRWTSMTPSQYRAALKGGPAAPGDPEQKSTPHNPR